MQMREVEKSKKTLTKNTTRIREIEAWFKYEYPSRLHRIARYQYLGLPVLETRWAVEQEAYHKENELRQLKGQPLLPELQYKELL